MRRVLSLILLLAFSLPLIAPALAFAQGPGANLPLCCRRNGKHHCAMRMSMGRNATDAPGVNASPVPERCPFYPAPLAPLSHIELASPMKPAAFAEIVSQPALLLQTHAHTHAALEHAHHKRGPPSDRL